MPGGWSSVSWRRNRAEEAQDAPPINSSPAHPRKDRRRFCGCEFHAAESPCLPGDPSVAIRISSDQADATNARSRCAADTAGAGRCDLWGSNGTRQLSAALRSKSASTGIGDQTLVPPACPAAAPQSIITVIMRARDAISSPAPSYCRMPLEAEDRAQARSRSSGHPTNVACETAFANSRRLLIIRARLLGFPDPSRVCGSATDKTALSSGAVPDFPPSSRWTALSTHRPPAERFRPSRPSLPCRQRAGLMQFILPGDGESAWRSAMIVPSPPSQERPPPSCDPSVYPAKLELRILGGNCWRTGTAPQHSPSPPTMQGPRPCAPLDFPLWRSAPGRA